MNIIKKIIVLVLQTAIFIQCAVGVLAADAADENVHYIYVSTKGNDLGDGSINNPLGTVGGAFTKISELYDEWSSSGISKSIVVEFMEGTYYINENLNWRRYTLPVTLRAHDGADVTISSGINITPKRFLRPNDLGDKIRKYNDAIPYIKYVDLGQFELTSDNVGELRYIGMFNTDNSSIPQYQRNGEFILDGTRLHPARYPDTGYITVSSDDILYAGTSGEDGPKLAIDYKDVAKAWTSSGIRMYGELKYQYHNYSLDIAEIDADEGYIKAKQAAPAGVVKGGRYYIYNLLEELDSEGEYYYDKTSNRLYFYTQGTPKNLELSTSGRFTLDGVKNFTFENLNFQNSRTMLIEIYNSENVVIDNCTFKNAETAVYIMNSKKCGVKNSVVSDVNNGIMISCDNKSVIKNLTPCQNFVINNDIYNLAVIDRVYKSGISLSGVGDVAAYNKVHGSEHLAVSLGGYANLVEYNEFYDTNKDCADSGTIYSGQNFAKRGNVIRYNYFHDLKGNGGLVAGVYLDDYFSGTEVYSNLFENCHTGVQIHRGFDNYINGNVFMNSDYGARIITAANDNSIIPDTGSIYNSSNNIRTTYDSPIWRMAFPELYADNRYTYDGLKLSNSNIVTNNRFFDTGTGIDKGSYPEEVEALNIISENKSESASVLSAYSGSTSEKVCEYIKENIDSKTVLIGDADNVTSEMEKKVIADVLTIFNRKLLPDGSSVLLKGDAKNGTFAAYNGAGESISASLIAAEYENSGKMNNCTVIPVTVPVMFTDSLVNNYDGSKKIFLWDGIKTMKPLSNTQ